MLLRFYFAISNYINSMSDRAIYDGFYSSFDREYLSIYSLHRYINSFIFLIIFALVYPNMFSALLFQDSSKPELLTLRMVSIELSRMNLRSVSAHVLSYLSSMRSIESRFIIFLSTNDIGGATEIGIRYKRIMRKVNRTQFTRIAWRILSVSFQSNPESGRTPNQNQASKLLSRGATYFF